jgi:hypothetical protein
MKRQSKPIARKTPVKKRNSRRMKRRKTEAYGGAGRLEWVHGQECFVESYAAFVEPRPTDDGEEIARCGVCCAGSIEAMHTKSRAAGGTARHVVPACTRHHREAHVIGHQSFARKYGINLKLAAELYDALWQLHELQQAA